MDLNRLAGLFLCVALATLVNVPGAEAKERETLTVTGKIEAAEMRRDKVAVVFIEDAQLGRFLVHRGTDLGKKLLKQVGETIRATGYVGDAVRGSRFDRYIDVLEYEIVPEESDPAPTAAPDSEDG